MKKFVKSDIFLKTILPSLAATFIVAGIVSATTIGTNISTGGTLSVTGASTLTGDSTVGGTLGVTGATALSGNSTFGDAAADINLFTGALHASTTALFTATTTFYNTLDMRGGNQGLIFGASSNGSGIQSIQGKVYYDTTNKVLKMSDGTDWFTIGTSTSGITLSGAKLQLADLTTQYITVGTTTQQGFSMLTVEATSTTAIPLSLVARSSQTANLLQIRNSASANLLYVNSSGGLFASSTLQVTGATTLYDTLTALNNSTAAISIKNASGVPVFEVDTTNARASTTQLFVSDGSSSPRFNASTTAISIGNGTPVAGLRFGTCSVNPQSITIATSSLISTSCAATGVQSGDTVFVTPPSDEISLDNWLVFEGASASSTSGYIEITLFNASTTAAIDGPARTWKWMAIR